MKKLSIYIISAAFLVTGCSKKLDVQPTQSVDEEFVFTTDANIKAALNGTYDVVSGASLLGGDVQMYSELLGAGDEITWVGTFNQPDEIYRKEILTNNSFISATYLEGYRAINICNNILANINTVNSADRDRVKGQALFLRGLVYFELVELFAKPYSAGNVGTNPGLQIILTPTVNGEITAANRVARSSVQDTYTQIVADLVAAKPIIGGEVGEYGSEYAVSAVLSRVYLQMGNYAGARDEANNVIENSGAELETDYAKVFNNTSASKEDIYVLPVTAQDGSNDLQVYFSITDYGARDGDIEINEDHINLYDASDSRGALFYLDGSDIYRSGKWKFQYRFLPVIRLGEMYLTRAEANFRLSTSVGATPAQDMLAIRSRAGLGAVAINLANIRYERRLELAHEGQRIQDIKRFQESIDGFSYDANELVFPIPLREINAGGGILTQNPGY